MSRLESILFWSVLAICAVVALLDVLVWRP